MEQGKFNAVAAEIRKLGYKLESMKFRNEKGSEVTIFIDESKTQSEEINSRGTSKSMIEEWRS